MVKAIGTAPNQIPTNANLGTAAYRDSDEFAELVSPALTGTPTAPTAASGTNTTQIATTAFVNTATNDTVAALTPGATVDIDLSTGTIFTLTPDQDTTLTVSNPEPVDSMTLILTGAGTGYEISNASYDSVSVSLASQDASFNDMFFRADGLKFYMVGSTTDTIYQYTLSTAWDLTTLTYDSVSFSTSPESNAVGLYFKPDGTEMYFCGTAFQDARQYTLSTAWDVSTATLTDQYSLVVGQTPRGLTFKPDGTKIFSIHDDQRIYSHTLSTAWDLTTVSKDAGSFLASSQDTDCQALDFSADGTRMFVIGATNDSVYQYTLSTPWDTTTATYDSVAFSISAQDATPKAISFINGGLKMIMGGRVSNTIYQYSTTLPELVTYPASFKWSGGSAPTLPGVAETDVLTFFTTDTGTTWYGFQDGDAMA